MALAPLAPWLAISPELFLNARKAGMGTGVQIAENQTRAAQADAALAQRAWEFEQGLRQRASEQAAEGERAAAQLAATERYRLGSLAEQQAGNAAQAAHWSALEAQNKAQLAQPTIRTLADGTVLQIRRDGTVIVLRQGTPKAPPAEYETTTKVLPATEGVPAVPADTGKRTLFGVDWLRKDVPPTPAVPAVEAQPERRITTRKPVPPVTPIPPNAAAPVAPEQPSPVFYAGGVDGSPERPLPLPQDKSALVIGKYYDTARGAAMWNGRQFVK